MIAADLGEQTGSERNAALVPGARLVKAFIPLFGRITAQEPRHAEGRLVAFLAGDDKEANGLVAAFIDSLGFAPVDFGSLHETGPLMQVGGGPLSGLHLLKDVTPPQAAPKCSAQVTLNSSPGASYQCPLTHRPQRPSQRSTRTAAACCSPRRAPRTRLPTIR